MNIRTTSLLIRKVIENDFEQIHRMYTTPENMKYVSSGRFDWTEEEIREKYQINNMNYPNGFGLFVVEQLSNGKVIGEAGIFNSFNNPVVLEIGYILDYSCWGKGYGTVICNELINYCFQQLTCLKVVARMYADNIASVKVSEKCGMQCMETGFTPDGKKYYQYVKEK